MSFNPDEPRDDHGEWSGGGSNAEKAKFHRQEEAGHTATANVTVEDREIKSSLGNRHSEVYSHRDSADATLQVVTHDDGNRSVSDVYVPAGDRGKGIATDLYMKALERGPLLANKTEGDNFTHGAASVRARLVAKGLAEIVGPDQYGNHFLQKPQRGQP